MRRSVTQDWETTPSSRHHSYKTPNVASRTSRRVTLEEEPWQSDIYSVPRPTRWTPETDMKSAEQTPHPVQSPPFHATSNRRDDEIQRLKERLSLQENLMEKMMNEITLLRKDVREKNSFADRDGTDDMTDRYGVENAYRNSQRSERSRRKSPDSKKVHPRSEEPMGSAKAPARSAGAQFVAEFSELIELDSGQHELLASIMDQQHRNRSYRRRHRDD